MQRTFVDLELEREPKLIYTNDTFRLNAAVMLLSFGIKQFEKTFHFTKRKELAESLSKLPSEYFYNESVRSLTSDALCEYFRIIVSLQNYMQALLLKEQYLIHKIDHQKHQALSKKQGDEPIKISDFVSESNYEENGQGVNILQGIQNKTINFSSLLKTSYQEVVAFPDLILQVTKNYNEVRNLNHFHIKETTAPLISEGSGCGSVEQIEQLNRFVENNMRKLLSDLEGQLPAIS